MRNVCLFLASLFMTGCLYGAGRASSSTTFSYDADPSRNHVTSTVTTNASGQQFGAGIPFVIGDPGLTGYGYGGYGMIGGIGGIGGSGCVLNPDHCAGPETMTAYAPNAIGSYVAPVAPPNGSYAPASGPPVDISEMQDRLAQVEKKTNTLVPVVKKSVEVQCQQVLAHPEDIKNEKERALEVQSCTEELRKTAAKAPLAPAKED